MKNNMHPEISELEEDIIKEIINISLAKVADSLSVIARESVLLDIPHIDVVTPEELNGMLPSNDPSDSVIQSDIRGDVEGETFLLFKAQQSSNLAEICLGTPEEIKENYAALQRSLLMEISNMLTGTLVTQLANIFNLSIHGMPPVIVPFRLRKTFRDMIANLIVFKPFVLTVRTEFLKTRKTVEMPMIIVFNIDTLKVVLDIIRKRTASDPSWLMHMSKMQG